MIMTRPSKLLPKFLLLPPFFLLTATSLWIASFVFPYSLLYICHNICFRVDTQLGSTFDEGLSSYDVSTQISLQTHIEVEPEIDRLASDPLRIDVSEETITEHRKDQEVFISWLDEKEDVSNIMISDKPDNSITASDNYNNSSDSITVSANYHDQTNSTDSITVSANYHDQTNTATIVTGSLDSDQTIRTEVKINTSTTFLGDAANPEIEKLMEEIRATAGWPADMVIKNQSSSSSCEGRRVYVYHLPAKFNADLMKGCRDIMPWFDMCEYMQNQGLGELIRPEEEGDLVPSQRWYGTHQYALEMIFHARIQSYTCRTLEPSQADVFYVPFYAGLDVLRWHFRTNVSNELRDALVNDLLTWLGERPWWARNGGRDHVLVLGKISWDFQRAEGPGGWGNRLLAVDATRGALKLLIERQPWEPTEVGVPHPTFFHPEGDADVRDWQMTVERSLRRHVVSFAGKPRANQTAAGGVRRTLIEQCGRRTDACRLLDCEGQECLRPARVMGVFLRSEFCLQPPGDSPTRRSIFDSLVAGCIPVLFDAMSAYYQYPWHLPADPASYSVFLPADAVRAGRVDVVGTLEAIPPAQRARMRHRIAHDILPGLLYAAPGHSLSAFRDAFDISLDGLLSRVAHTLQPSGVL